MWLCRLPYEHEYLDQVVWVTACSDCGFPIVYRSGLEKYETQIRRRSALHYLYFSQGIYICNLRIHWRQMNQNCRHKDVGGISQVGQGYRYLTKDCEILRRIMASL